MSSFLCNFTLIWSIIGVVHSADCQSQKTEAACRLVSGCEWFNRACICATDVKIDFIFAVDVSGSIGFEGFKQEKEWLSDIVQGGLTQNSRVGWTLFSTNVNTSRITLTNYTTAELVQYIAGIYYPKGYTNTRGALDAIITEYNTNHMDARQKVAIMTTDGNPCSRYQCPYDVCDIAPSLKAAGIRLIVLGVGPDLTAEYLTCLLQDPDTDYMAVDSYDYDDFNKILPQLQEITCPVEYNMKITEVKPQPDTYGEFGSRFVEIWNSGSSVIGEDILLDGLVTGTLPNTLIIEQAQFLVLYEFGATFRNITCVDCECNPMFDADEGAIRPPYLFKCADSVYFACFAGSAYCAFSETMDNTNWWQQINDTSLDANIVIDEVKYEANGATNVWPTILNGYTFELKQNSFDNDIGGNWQQSCYLFGTPGDVPISCKNANCSDVTCRLNGAVEAIWNPAPEKCICPSGYYASACTCLAIPNPSFCAAYRIKNSSSTWYTRYVWQRADYEGVIQYELQYWNEQGTNTTVQSYATVKRALDYDWNNRGVSRIAGLLRTVMTDKNNGEYRGEWFECLAITQQPTISPTPSPTMSPTPMPSLQPTQPAIHSLPWLFIAGDICASDRCDCSALSLIKEKECCMSASDECQTYNRRFTAVQVSHGVADNGKGDLPQYITIQSHSPDGIAYVPPFYTSADYQFEYLGTKNVSNCSISEDDDSEEMAMLITPRRGRIEFDADGSISNKRITFYIKPTFSSIVNCESDAIFRLNLLNCSSDYSYNLEQKCEIVFPFQYTLFIQQLQPGSPLSWFEREMEPILWWLVAGLIVLILLIGMVVYFCWNKTRWKEKALSQKENELEELIETDEFGMAPRLNKQHIAYNPLALPSTQSSALIAANVDVTKNTKIPQNERANVMVEKFNEKQEYGPTYGAILASENNNSRYNAPSYK